MPSDIADASRACMDPENRSSIEAAGAAAAIALNALIEGVRMSDNSATELGIFNFANSFFKSAQALRGVEVKVTHREMPVRFLYYHALELFMKSFLKLNGLTDSKIKAIGHDVRRLASKCKAAGLDFDDEDLEVIDLMGGDTIIRARYLETGAFRWPDVDALDRTTKSLYENVRTSLRGAGHRVR